MLEIVDAADRLAHWLTRDSVNGLSTHDALLVLSMAEIFVGVDTSLEYVADVRREAKQLLGNLLNPTVQS